MHRLVGTGRGRIVRIPAQSPGAPPLATSQDQAPNRLSAFVDHFREGTDDAVWVIPELVREDMYRMPVLTRAMRHADGVVIDCGAHIGVFSCLLAAHGLKNPIHAFEPEPSNYALLTKNSQRFRNITPINKGVGPRQGRLRLYDLGDTGRWSMVPRQACGRAFIVVEVADIYAYIRDIGHVALLKLDLEGFEAVIVNGMPADVLERIHLLVIEEHHEPVDYERLRNAGFGLWFMPLGNPRHRVYRKDVPWGLGKTFRKCPHRRERARVLLIANVAALSRRMDRSLYYGYRALGQHPSVTLMGPGCPGFVQGMPVKSLFERLGRPDFIIHGVDLRVTGKPLVDGLANVAIPKAMELVDTWEDPSRQQWFLNHYRFNYAFHALRPWEEEYEQNCPDVKFVWTPSTVNTDVFRDYGLQKENDILFYGTVGEMYPFRLKLCQLLERLSLDSGLRIKIILHPGYWDEGYEPQDWHYVGERLAREINKSWITIATGNVYPCLFAKHLEIAACKSLVAGSMPDQARPFFGRGFVDLTMHVDDEIAEVFKFLLHNKEDLLSRVEESYASVRENFSAERYAVNVLDLVDCFV